MMPGPDGDTVGVQEGSDIVRMKALDCERDNGSAVDGHGRPVDRHPGDSCESLERLARERPLVLRDSFHAEPS